MHTHTQKLKLDKYVCIVAMRNIISILAETTLSIQNI